MKKIIFLLFVVGSFSYASAQTCLDLTVNLSRGQESSDVLSLQNFLTEKGFLSVKPNGYFGPSTFKAVKLYQRSVGIIQTGGVFSLTRAAIKKDSCVLPVYQNQPVSNATSTNTVSVSTSTPVQTSSVNKILPPYITSVDKATFISGAIVDAPITIHGGNFSTSSDNILILRLENLNRDYVVGGVTSVDGVTIATSSSFTVNQITCGVNCSEMLPIGNYDVIIKNSGGESNAGFISIKSFSSSVTSGTIALAILSKTTNSRLGTITVGSSEALSLENIAITISSYGFNTSSLSNFTLKDELSGNVIGGGGVFDLGHETLLENHSKIYSLYADSNVPTSGQVTIDAVITVKDFIGKNLIHIKIPTFIATAQGLY